MERRGGLFQNIADPGGDSPPLAVFVDIQAVQIAGVVHVPEADDSAVLHSNDCAVGKKRGIPDGQVNLPGCPSIQLLGRVILCIDCVYRVIKSSAMDGQSELS